MKAAVRALGVRGWAACLVLPLALGCGGGDGDGDGDGDGSGGSGNGGSGGSGGSSAGNGGTSSGGSSGSGGSSAGNGGTSSGGSGDGSAFIVFPPPVSVTDAASITVRGTVDGGATGVIVNSVVATSDDDFATWQAEVPLSMGDTEIRVTVESSSGSVVGATASIERSSDPRRGNAERWSEYLEGLFWEEETNLVWVCDNFGDGVFSISLSTGNHDTISFSEPGITTGEGPELTAPTSVALVPDGSASIISDQSTIFRIMHSNGEREIFMGDGPEPAYFSSVSLNRETGRLYTIGSYDDGSSDVMEIDLDSGDRTVIGSGELISEGAMDEANNRILATETFSTAVLAIDLDSGDVSTFSSGDGSADLDRMAVSPWENEAYSLRGSTLVAVNLESGNRRDAFSADTIGEQQAGDGGSWTPGIAAYPHGVLAITTDSLLVIDPVTGETVFVSR